MTGPKFQTKIPCYSRVFLPGEQQPVDPPSKDEELRVIGLKEAWYYTQGNVILGLNSRFGFIFGSLWDFITNFENAKAILLQNVTKVLIKWVRFFITQCDSITKCSVYY